MPHVEQARLADYDELLAFCHRIFRLNNPHHLRFDDLYPDLYPRAESTTACHHVVREGGRIVAAAGLYPLDLQLGPVRLRVAGIGAVATDPAVRGRGCMSAILGRIWEVMRAERYPLSWLSGRRDRYAHFGWECTGTNLLFNLDAHAAGPLPEGWSFCQHDLDQPVPDDVWAAREAAPVRGVLGTAEAWRLHLRRPGGALQIARRGGQVAFAAVYAPARDWWEWGGAADGVRALAARAAAAAPQQVVLSPALDPDGAALFRGLASHWGAAGARGQLAVVDLAALCEAYAPLLRARWPAGRRLRLALDEPGCPPQAVELADGCQAAAAAAADNPVALPRLDLAAFCFGPRRPSETARLGCAGGWVDQVFPLPFLLPGSFCV